VAMRDVAPSILVLLRSGILKPFLDATPAAAPRRRASAAGTESAASAPAEEQLEDIGGRLVDRVALLSCALLSCALLS
jgi:hypothetical protein